MLFFLQKPPTNTQNVYMKYISYLKIYNPQNEAFRLFRTNRIIS